MRAHGVKITEPSAFLEHERKIKMKIMFKKKPSRKELEAKIETLEEENRDLKNKNVYSENACHNALSERDSNRKQINELTIENKDLKERNDILEKENAVFRQYYHLDEEPSQETKDKMYLDQRYREMDREIIRLQALLEAHSFRQRGELEDNIFRLRCLANMPFIAQPTLGALPMPYYNQYIYT